MYQGGGHKDAQAARIETALTRRDEFNRVMTPKEAFRTLCYGWVALLPWLARVLNSAAPSVHMRSSFSAKGLEVCKMCLVQLGGGGRDLPACHLTPLWASTAARGRAWPPALGEGLGLP